MYRLLAGVSVIAMLGGCVPSARTLGIGFTRVQSERSEFEPDRWKSDPATFFWPAAGKSSKDVAELIRRIIPAAEGQGALYVEPKGVRYEGPQGVAEAISRLKDVAEGAQGRNFQVEVRVGRVPQELLDGLPNPGRNQGSGVVVVLRQEDVGGIFREPPAHRWDLDVAAGQATKWLVGSQFAHVAGWDEIEVGWGEPVPDPVVDIGSFGIEGQVLAMPNGKSAGSVLLWTVVRLTGSDHLEGRPGAERPPLRLIVARIGTQVVLQEIPVLAALESGGAVVVPPGCAAVRLLPDPSRRGEMIAVVHCVQAMPR